MGLTVLTLVKNRAIHLARLIEGLHRSEVPPDELIVVDMNERPDSVPETAFPCRIMSLPSEGLPLARARNLAASAARSPHLLFLDVDCIPMRGLIGTMIHTLTAHDAVISAEIRYLGPGDAQPGWTEESLLKSGVSHPARLFPGDGVRQEPNAGLFWSLAFGIRRDRFEALGGFDEEFTGYGAEDTDFGFRAREAGTESLFMGGPGAFHQYHGVVDPPLHHFHDILRNAERFHKKWGRWPMEGWLKAFEALGLIVFTAERLTCLRAPDANDLLAARQSPPSRF
jgi:GT2 family glycosyltransferase